MIGLALSGGGSRAIAFHLGCLRALQERGVLQKVPATWQPWIRSARNPLTQQDERQHSFEEQKD
jgi:hypothetical protein